MMTRRTAMCPLLAVLACGQPVVPEFQPEEVAALELTAGGEEPMSGRRIPILVQATDGQGVPVAGAAVRMTIVEGSGRLESTAYGVAVGSSGRAATATLGSDGSAELDLIPWAPGRLSLEAYVSNQARVGDRIDLHVGLRIVLHYLESDLWNLEPGFHGGQRVARGTPVEWECFCESDWGVVGTRESTGETAFDSGTLGSDDVFRWMPEQEGAYAYRDPHGGARDHLTVEPPS